MNYNYYRYNNRVGYAVSWKYLDKNGDTVRAEQNKTCFSGITYASIPTDVAQIVVFHPKDRIPYSDEMIKKWVDNLNQCGFPVSLEIQANRVDFTIDLANYKYKMHVTCTLQLIRCLYEAHICIVPEHYFNYLDQNPLATLEEKFAFLQKAHADATRPPSYANDNHMVTHHDNFKKPIKQATLFKRLENISNGVYDKYDGDAYQARYEGRLLKLWQN